MENTESIDGESYPSNEIAEIVSCDEDTLSSFNKVDKERNIENDNIEALKCRKYVEWTEDETLNLGKKLNLLFFKYYIIILFSLSC
jgi:hypothetical protein